MTTINSSFVKEYDAAYVELDKARNEYYIYGTNAAIEYNNQIKEEKKKADVDYLNSLNKTLNNELSLLKLNKNNKIKKYDDERQKREDLLAKQFSAHIITTTQFNEKLSENNNIYKKLVLAAENEYQKSKNDIILKYTLERIETQKTILKNASDTQLRQVEINSKKGLVTTQQFELQKQSVIVDRLNNESILVKDTFDKQIMFYSKTEKAAKENADIIKLLESTKAKLLNDINQDIEDITLTTNNNIKKNTEEVYKERENYAKEAYEIEKQLIDAQIASTQNLIDINNVRISQLNSTANQYKNVLEEETDAIMENYGNQLFLLDEQKQKELKINEDNTINRKEKELEIEAKYNALIKKSGLDTAEAITAAKIKEIDRQDRKSVV
jgi:hypothetical protein